MATDEKPVVRPAGGAIAASRVHGAKLGEPPPELATPAPGEPYTTFYGARRVFFLTLLIAIGVISPMTGSIYMPALPTISRDLHASTEHVQLTVTVYLIFQGLSPMFVGANTDKVGRRPVLILSQLLYLVVNIIIFVLPNGNGGYVGLMILRCVQAVGSASTISIGAGAVQDITTPTDRAGVMSLFQASALVGTALAPLIGAAVTTGFGWRATFMFLFIYSATCTVALILFLQETMRKLVGNGSKPAPTLFHEALWSILTRQTVTQRTGQPRPGLPLPSSIDKDEWEGLTSGKKSERLLWARARETVSLAPLRYMVIPEVALCLGVASFPYASVFMLLTTLSASWQDIYHWTVMEVGLVFLCQGAGTMCASFFSGQILDWNIRRLQRRIAQDSKNAVEEASGGVGVTNWATFPLERARLVILFPCIALMLGSTIGYGWMVDKKVHPAAPMVMLFLNGVSFGAIVSVGSTMLVDYLPGRGAGATSCLNLVRCWLAAVLVSVVPYIYKSVGPGKCYTISGCIALVALPCGIVLQARGPAWRFSRFTREHECR